MIWICPSLAMYNLDCGESEIPDCARAVAEALVAMWWQSHWTTTVVGCTRNTNYEPQSHHTYHTGLTSPPRAAVRPSARPFPSFTVGRRRRRTVPGDVRLNTNIARNLFIRFLVRRNPALLESSHALFLKRAYTVRVRYFAIRYVC